MKGTPAWMAPELVNSVEYTQSVDVFSFGIVLWELLTCKRPWNDGFHTFTHQIMLATLRGERPDITLDEANAAPPLFIALMKECWDMDPEARPTFANVVVRLTKQQEVIVNATATAKKLKSTNENLQVLRADLAKVLIEEKEFALTKDYTAAHHAFERRKMIEKEIKKCDV